MRELHIQFHSFRDVQDFVAIATEHPFPIIVGNESYRVNGTSFMGMFSLDYTRPLKVCLSCSEPEYDQFRQQTERFLVE